MNIVSLVQARMSSSRLPGKVLLPLGDGSVLDQVVRRANRFSSQVVICTSVHEEDDPIEAHCKKRGLICVRGPLDDVFSRFRKALEHPQVQDSEYFVRITADSPLLSVEIGQYLIERLTPGMDYLRADYSSIPLGTGMEFVRTETFLSIDAATLDEAEKEHVTLALYEERGRYQAVEVSGPQGLSYPTHRLTLDYQEDYDLLTEIFDALDDPTTRDVVSLLDARPDLIAINASCAQRQARSQE